MKVSRVATPPERVASLAPAKGGEVTLREIFETEEAALVRFAYSILGRREVAEDMVQDAFLKLHRHWDEVVQPRAWLFRTVRNLSLNYLRDHKREVSKDETSEWSVDESAGDKLARLEAAGAVRMLIAEMPEEDRRLLLLKYHNHLKYEQIGKQTGLSIGNVGYKLHHLLKDLAVSLRRMGIEGPQG